MKDSIDLGREEGRGTNMSMGTDSRFPVVWNVKKISCQISVGI